LKPAKTTFLQYKISEFGGKFIGGGVKGRLTMAQYPKCYMPDLVLLSQKCLIVQNMLPQPIDYDE